MSRRWLFALSLLFAASSLRAATAVITLETSSFGFNRTEGTGEVTLIRSGDLSAACSVQYHVSIDAEVIDATASFDPKQQFKYIFFPIPYDHQVYDNRPSSAKNYFISISNPVGAVIGSPSTASLSVTENEAVPMATFQSTSAAEGDGGLTLVPIAVTLSAHLLATAFVDVFAIGGTAEPGTDYEGVGTLPHVSLGQVRFDAFQTTGQIVVRVKGDQHSEPDETIFIGGGMPGFTQSPTASGILTILNDDYILTPGTLRIARGTVASLSVATSVPTPVTDHVLLSSSDPSVAAVPPFVDVPAGSLGKSFDVTAAGPGSAVIAATWPPSRGGGTMAARVDVYIATFYSFEKSPLSVTLGQSAAATMHFDPPPSEPLLLYLFQTNPTITNMPPFFTVGTDGTGSFTLRGDGIGSSVITTTVPASYGGATTGFRFDVTPAATFSIGRLDTASGPSTGGQIVRIYGNAMGSRCTAMFDGVSGLNTSLVTAGSFTTSPPPHDPGLVDLAVRCGTDTETLSKAYTYTPQTSRITGLLPTIGSAGGGVLVAVTGENLRRGRCSLWFGGAAATIMQNDQATTMLVAAPPHAPGSVDVLMRCGSDASTLAGAFLYTSNEILPLLAGINPPSAAPGDRIIVSGSALRADDAIYFDNAAGLDVTSTPEQHFVTVPDLLLGYVTITLRDVAGHIAAGPSFRVLPVVAPQIASAPTHVLTSSEFPISGAGLRSSLTFLLGGTTLQPVAIASTYGQLRLPQSIVPGTYALTIANQNVAPRTIQVTSGLAIMSVSVPCSS
ncbi:MAG TPA: IPT/TIG domain-containing protein, partial [Thermoanaerobaculia bacterium]|nr:IPT/TIG domain-containing protein [Thermoanaerobaculia bacterium]